MERAGTNGRLQDQYQLILAALTPCPPPLRRHPDAQQHHTHEHPRDKRETFLPMRLHLSRTRTTGSDQIRLLLKGPAASAWLGRFPQPPALLSHCRCGPSQKMNQIQSLLCPGSELSQLSLHRTAGRGRAGGQDSEQGPLTATSHHNIP